MFLSYCKYIIYFVGVQVHSKCVCVCVPVAFTMFTKDQIKSLQNSEVNVTSEIDGGLGDQIDFQVLAI